MVRRAMGDQPGIVPAGLLKRVIVGERKIFNDGLAVDHLARSHNAALRVAIGQELLRASAQPDQLLHTRSGCPAGCPCLRVFIYMDEYGTMRNRMK